MSFGVSIDLHLELLVCICFGDFALSRLGLDLLLAVLDMTSANSGSVNFSFL